MITLDVTMKNGDEYSYDFPASAEADHENKTHIIVWDEPAEGDDEEPQAYWLSMNLEHVALAFYSGPKSEMDEYDRHNKERIQAEMEMHETLRAHQKRR